MSDVEMHGLGAEDGEEGFDTRETTGAALLQTSPYVRVPGVVGGVEPSEGGQGEVEWSGIRDLDGFLKDVYTFYVEKGLLNLMVGRVCTLLNLGFTVFASTIALAFVEWGELQECADADKCRHLFAYVDWSGVTNPTAWQAVVLFYAAAAAAYWAWLLLSLPVVFWRMLRVHRLFTHRLSMPTAVMQCTEWDKVLKRLEWVHRHRYRLHSHVERMTALDVTCRIMREDNYIIALITSDEPADGGVLEGDTARGHAPPAARDGWRFQLSAPSLLAPLFTHSRVFTRHVELNLRLALLRGLFRRDSSSRDLDRGFVGSSARFRLRLVVLALANVILMPAVLIYRITRFTFEHAESLKSRRVASLLQSRWTVYATWRFRQINELPHLLEARLNASYKHADEYKRQFPSPVLTTVARSVSYLCAASMAVLLPLYLVDDAILLHLSVADRSLLSVMLLLATAIGVAQSLVPGPAESILKPRECLAEVLKHTHYGPPQWRVHGNLFAVRDAFLEYYPPLVLKFASEIVSILLTPYLLGVVLVRDAPNILRFLRDRTADMHEVGDVLRESMFAPTAVAEEQTDALRTSRLGQGIAYFSMRHPHWRPGRGASAIVQSAARVAARARSPSGGTASLDSSDASWVVDEAADEVDVSEAALLLSSSDSGAAARRGQFERSFAAAVGAGIAEEPRPATAASRR